MLPELPMEVWARVASFIPFPSLLSTFWALTNAGLLPETGTNSSNAFLQFCSQVSEEEEEEEIEIDDLEGTYAYLVEMGFDPDLVIHAIRMCRGNLEAILEFVIDQNLYA